MISRRQQKLALCLSVGLLGLLVSLVPAALRFEENAGLDWLFLLRGVSPPPDDVVLVSIDTESAAELGLHRNPDRWPRSLHAELTRRLSQAKAAVIVFDLYFDSPRGPAEDRAFAAAVGDAGNVIVLEQLTVSGGLPGTAGTAPRIERRIPPIPELRPALLATAPFPLPLVPVKVSQFWVFGPSNPDVPTLPAMALHAYVADVHDEFLALLDEVRPRAAAALAVGRGTGGQVTLNGLGRRIRGLMAADGDIAREMRARLSAGTGQPSDTGLSSSRRVKLEALIAMYGGPDSRYLNFHGPARSVTTIPYSTIVGDDWNPETADLEGKAVFVGYADENPIDQQDEFFTAFSGTTGVSLSGAEIGATAFSNLLNTNTIRPLPIPGHLVLVFLWGAAVAALLIWLPARFAVASVAVAGLAYSALAFRAFEASYLWLPIMVPLLGQIPVALIGVFGWKYAFARAQSEKHRRTLGFYLPPQAVDELSREAGPNRPSARLSYGTCLATDVEEYTSLSERLQPDELHGLLNEYYALLFSEVKRRGGYVTDAGGDSMIAVWTSADPDPVARANACRAAEGIRRAVERFNAGRAVDRLPTRIGVHSGRLLLGDVGADSHFEYRAVGDIVNTASRIQGLNKHLHTDLLVSEDVVARTGYTFSRVIGDFRLAGKTVPLPIHDMVTFEDNVPRHRRELAQQFAEALARFHARQWDAAMRAFARLLERFPADGPSRFYLALCREYLESEPGDDWCGVIAISDK